MINNVLVACRFIWSALGEGSSSTTIRSNEVSHRNFSRADLDNAAKKAYSSASVRATDQQASVVMHLMNNFQLTFVLFGCGTGKSGIYILQQATACLLHVWCQSSEEYCYLFTQRSTRNASYASYEVFP